MFDQSCKLEPKTAIVKHLQGGRLSDLAEFSQIRG